MKVLALAGVLALALTASACKPEDIAKTCAVAKAAQKLIDAGRGGENERKLADGLRTYCTARGHAY